MTSIKDRTAELFSAIHSLEARGGGPSYASAAAATGSSSYPPPPPPLRNRPGAHTGDSATSPLLGQSPVGSLTSLNAFGGVNGRRLSTATVNGGARVPKSEFSVRAAHIARGIQTTAAKLEKLGKLAKRKTLFDDRPVEITELTAVIKQDITHLNDQIRGLQAFQRAQNSRARAGHQEEEHSQSVVVGLQSSLARASQGFAEVLEIRTENMKAQKERRDQFSSSPNFALGGPSTDSPLFRMDRPNGGGPMSIGFASPSSPTAANGSGFMSIDMAMTPAEQQQLMQATADASSGYMDQRGAAIDTIESTIAELGQIFTQLGSLVAQQQEQVRRIDDNIVDVEANVEMARSELFKYWRSVSSNRLLMAKVFAVVLVFVLIFTMFL
ncbi:t-SNARE [Blastocladiella britannica]|nr:t-SNARE [Blastocladiella britannica]